MKRGGMRDRSWCFWGWVSAQCHKGPAKNSSVKFVGERSEPVFGIHRKSSKGPASDPCQWNQSHIGILQ